MLMSALYDSYQKYLKILCGQEEEKSTGQPPNSIFEKQILKLNGKYGIWRKNGMEMEGDIVSEDW